MKVWTKKHLLRNDFACAESSLLLVKGVQLVVNQPQLLRVRHLMLFLDVRFTRLLHALAARHRDRFLRFFTACKGSTVTLSSRRSADFQDVQQDRNRLVAIESRPCMRVLVSAHTIYWSTPSAHGRRENWDKFFRIFYRIFTPLTLISDRFLSGRFLYKTVKTDFIKATFLRNMKEYW